MWWGCRPQHCVLLFLIAGLASPGAGNEGSITGSCHCDHLFSNPKTDMTEHFRKYLKNYESCLSFVRFQLPSRTVCGPSTAPWVLKLRICFDNGECGRRQVPKPTERSPSDMGTSTQMYLSSTLPSTQQPMLPAAGWSMEKGLNHSNETSMPTVDHTVGDGPEAGVSQKQLEDAVGPAAGTSAVVPVLSLLGIAFVLTAVLSYVLCKNKKEHSREYFQPHYEPVAADSNA